MDGWMAGGRLDGRKAIHRLATCNPTQPTQPTQHTWSHPNTISQRCHKQYATGNMSPAPCHRQHATSTMPQAPCHRQHATSNMPQAPCHRQHARLVSSRLTHLTVPGPGHTIPELRQGGDVRWQHASGPHQAIDGLGVQLDVVRLAAAAGCDSKGGGGAVGPRVGLPPKCLPVRPVSLPADVGSLQLPAGVHCMAQQAAPVDPPLPPGFVHHHPLTHPQQPPLPGHLIPHGLSRHHPHPDPDPDPLARSPPSPAHSAPPSRADARSRLDCHPPAAQSGAGARVSQR
ncbi:hypothetical protein V8C86DRAFT_1210087 [Haematococcus lacustris]